MDEATLLGHRALWVQETSQSPNASLEALTIEERDCYNNLRAHTWGERVRLEQERLGWPGAMETLMQALGNAVPGGRTPAPAGDALEAAALE